MGTPAAQAKYQRTSVKYKFTTYQKNARLRSLAFDLTLEEFSLVVSRPCVYCGFQPEEGWNGVDRVDSHQGYEVGNCVTCCKLCNGMKSNLPLGVWLAHVDRIAAYQHKG